MAKKTNILKDDIQVTKKIASENLVDKSVPKNLVKKRMLKINFHTFEVESDDESNYINLCLFGYTISIYSFPDKVYSFSPESKDVKFKSLLLINNKSAN